MGWPQGHAVLPRSRLWDVKSGGSMRYLLMVLRSYMRLSGKKRHISPNLPWPLPALRSVHVINCSISDGYSHGCIFSWGSDPTQAAMTRSICLGALVIGTLSLVMFWWSFWYNFIICLLLKERERVLGSTPVGVVAQGCL